MTEETKPLAAATFARLTTFEQIDELVRSAIAANAAGVLDDGAMQAACEAADSARRRLTAKQAERTEAPARIRSAAITRPTRRTDGRQTPIDPNDRARVIAEAEAARRDGRLTSACVDILRSLLYDFANLSDGRCFPGYKAIAAAAGRCERTVGRCLPVLEAHGFLTWVRRFKHVRERVAGIGHIFANIWRVMRTSNSYSFPTIAKRAAASIHTGHFSRETTIPVSFSLLNQLALVDLGDKISSPCPAPS